MGSLVIQTWTRVNKCVVIGCHLLFPVFVTAWINLMSIRSNLNVSVFFRRFLENRYNITYAYSKNSSFLLLTHFWPMFPFCGVFRGYKMGTLARCWLNRSACKQDSLLKCHSDIYLMSALVSGSWKRAPRRANHRKTCAKVPLH